MSRKQKQKEVEEESSDSSENIVCPYESILGYQKSGSQVEYYVKLKGEPYKRSEWVKAEELKKFAQNSPVILRASKNLASLNTDAPFYDPKFDQIDRIIASKGKQYFVKWKNLPFEQNTWEKRVDSASLKLFRDREKETFPEIKGSVDVPPTFEFEMLTKSSIGKFVLEPQQLSCLNLLLSNFCRGNPSNVVDQMNLDLYLSVVAFIKFCFEEIEIIGPYLIVCSPRKIRKWYKLLRKMKRPTCLLYHGSQESRKIIQEYSFSDRGKLKFHICVTTGDDLQQDVELLSRVHWRVAVFDDAQRVTNPQSKMFEICESLRIGHRINVRSTSVTSDYPELSSISHFLLEDKRLLSETDKKACEKACSMMQAAIGGRTQKESSFTTRYIDCPLSPVQRNVLNSVLNEDIEMLKVGNGVVTAHKILRICNHPFLVFGREYVMENVDFIESSTKLKVLSHLLRDASSSEKRVLVVSQFPLMLDLVEDLATLESIPFERIRQQSSQDLEECNKPLILYCPNYLEFIGLSLESVNEIVFLDCSSPDVLALLDEASNCDISIVYLTCSDCLETRLNCLCSVKQADASKTETAKICRISAISALMSTDVPSPEQLVENSLPEPIIDSPSEVMADELNVVDFWETFQDTTCIPTNSTKIPSEHEWTQRDRDQLTRNLFRFGWNQWEKLATASGLRIQNDILQTVSHVILKEIVDACPGSPTDDFEFLRTLNFTDIDRTIFDTNVFADASYRQWLSDNSRFFLRQMNVLSYLASNFSDARRPLLEDAPSSAVPDFWTEDRDYELLLGTLRYGFGCYEHFPLDIQLQSICFSSPDHALPDSVEFRKLNDRVLFLGEFLKKSSTLEKKDVEAPTGESSCDRSASIDSKWSKEEKKTVVDYLLRMGMDVTESGDRDYESMLHNCNLSDKTPDELRAFIDDFLSYGEVPPNPQSSQLQKNSYRAVNRIAGMNKLREVLRNKDDESLLSFFQQAPKWRLVPEAWSPEHESFFFQEIMKSGFNTMEATLQTEKFNGMFENGKIPTFMIKAESVIKRINTLYDAHQKLSSVPKKDKSAPASASVKASNLPSYDALEKGDFTFPLALSPTTELWSIGNLVTDRPKFHTSRYIYPNGYKVSRMFPSTVRPSEKVKWFCEIVDTGLDCPVFRIWMEDLPGNVYEGATPTAPWTLATKVIAKKLKNKPISVSGPEAFLLTMNPVIFLLQNLPGIDQLSEYKMKDFRSLRSKSFCQMCAKPVSRWRFLAEGVDPAFVMNLSETVLSEEIRLQPLSKLFISDCNDACFIERPIPPSIANDPSSPARRLFSTEVFNEDPRPLIPVREWHENEPLSGFLSTSDDHLDDQFVSVSVPPEHPLSDDSATDRNDPKHPGSSQLCRTANVAMDGALPARIIDRDEDKTVQPNVIGMRGSTHERDSKVLRPLSGKTCVVAPVNADYQPLYHNWQDPKEIPKVHMFYFEGYTQSPFDTPPVNVPKYLAQKEALREKRNQRKREQDGFEPTVCEICRAKIKEAGHRESHRHKSKVDDLLAHGCWEELDRRAADLFRMYGDQL